MESTMKVQDKFKNFKLRGEEAAVSGSSSISSLLCRFVGGLAVIGMLVHVTPGIFFAIREVLVSTVEFATDVDGTQQFMSVPAGFFTAIVVVATLAASQWGFNVLDRRFQHLSAEKFGSGSGQKTDDSQLGTTLAFNAIQGWGKEVTIYATLDIEKPETLHNFELLKKALLDAYKLGVEKRNGGSSCIPSNGRN